MLQQLWRVDESFAFSGGDGLPEVLVIAVNDDVGKKLEASHAEMLPFDSAVADFNLVTEMQGIFLGAARSIFAPSKAAAPAHPRRSATPSAPLKHIMIETKSLATPREQLDLSPAPPP